jgi:hypothetical protein
MRSINYPIFLSLLVLSTLSVSAFGVSSPHWETNPLELYPGETGYSTHTLINTEFPEGENVTITAFDGAGISELLTGTNYTIPYLNNSVKVIINSTAPLNATPGDVYNISFKIKESNPGGFFGIGFTIPYPVLIIPNPNESECVIKEVQADAKRLSLNFKKGEFDWNQKKTETFDGLNTGNLTLHAIVKLKGHKNWNSFLKHNWVGGWTLFSDNTGSVYFGMDNHKYARSTKKLQLGREYAITGVYDGHEMKLYIDGELAGKKFLPGFNFASNGNVMLGSINGHIKKIAIYNAALSKAELKKLIDEPIFMRTYESTQNWNIKTTDTYTGLNSKKFSLYAKVNLSNHKNWNNYFKHNWVGGWTLFSDTNGKAYFGIDNHKYATSNTNALELGKEYIIIGVYDGSQMKLYINGELVGTKSFSNFAVDKHGKIILGGIDGKIHDLRIFNKALSNEEISDLNACIS